MRADAKELPIYEAGNMATVFIDGICQIERRGPLCVLTYVDTQKSPTDGLGTARYVQARHAMLEADALAMAEQIIETLKRKQASTVNSLGERVAVN